ncbi:MAG TPA: class C sortase, partial [Microbacteriaceae bacterium]|nr:class C sortase [Microbacteriaceae bacterium]
MQNTMSKADQAASLVPAGRTPNSAKQQKLAVSILLQFLAMVGIGVFVYSSAADWFARLNHNAEISGYTSSVVEADPQQISQTLQVAQEYNSSMPAGMLRDPYLTPEPVAVDDNAYAKYEQLLRLNNVDEAGSTVIGEVTYPSLGIGLPIYHGTSESVLT